MTLIGNRIFGDIIQLRWDHPWPRWAIVQYDSWPHSKKSKQTQTRANRERLRGGETDGVMCPQAKECQGLPVSPEPNRKSWPRFSPKGLLGRTQVSQHLNFGLLASWIVREHIAVGFCHPVLELCYHSSSQWIHIDVEVHGCPQGLVTVLLTLPSCWFCYEPPHGSKRVASDHRRGYLLRNKFKGKIVPLFYISANGWLISGGSEWVVWLSEAVSGTSGLEPSAELCGGHELRAPDSASSRSSRPHEVLVEGGWLAWPTQDATLLLSPSSERVLPYHHSGALVHWGSWGWCD